MKKLWSKKWFKIFIYTFLTLLLFGIIFNLTPAGQQRLKQQQYLEKQKKASEDKKVQEQKRIENEQKVQEQKRIEEEQKAQEQKRIEEEQKAQEQKRIEDEQKAQEQKRIEDEQKVQEQSSTTTTTSGAHWGNNHRNCYMAGHRGAVPNSYCAGI